MACTPSQEACAGPLWINFMLVRGEGGGGEGTMPVPLYLAAVPECTVMLGGHSVG
jgi:hypothetical protein